MARRNWNRIFVTGGTSFLGLRVVAALIEQGADVTVLVRPENEDKLGALRRHVRLVSGNVWDRASLKGRSRGHGAVVHLVGSIHAQPERGLTFQQLNLVSARNAISMAVSDGVPYFVLLSAVAKPLGVSSEYIYSKREAEDYLRGSGLTWAIVARRYCSTQASVAAPVPADEHDRRAAAGARVNRTPCAAIGRHRRAWNRQARPARRASPLPALLRGRSAAARPGEAPQERAGAAPWLSRSPASPSAEQWPEDEIRSAGSRTAEGRISANPSP